jgi:hypothetical protein
MDSPAFKLLAVKSCVGRKPLNLHMILLLCQLLYQYMLFFYMLAGLLR